MSSLLGKEMMKKMILWWVIFCAVNATTISQTKPKPITLPPGKDSIVIEGTTAKPNDFLLKVRKAQKITIAITSPKGQARFSFDTKKVFDEGLDFMCEECRTMSEKIRPGLWIISVFHLPESKDQRPTTFSLTITLK